VCIHHEIDFPLLSVLQDSGEVVQALMAVHALKGLKMQKFHTREADSRC